MNFENVTAAVSMTVLLAYAASAVGQSPDMALTYVSPGAPPVECFARVNYDLNATLPGYLVQDAAGQACVPFSYRGQFVPPDYDGDYFAAEFTDSKIKERYGACMRERTCRERLATMQPLVIVPSELRATGAIDPAAKVDPHSVVDLRKIRRPAYFGHARYREPIAEAEERTYTVEFEVPREAYERVQIGRTDPVKLRGWYLEGSGIRDAEGRATRAVIVWIGGRTIETTAIQAPNELRYQYDEATTAYVARSFPNATSEQWGARAWRNYAYELNRAGFDVVTFDKRGHGISGGYNDVNTLEQARDMWRVLDALETGVGLEALSPSGELLAGNAVRGRFLAGLKAKEIPVIFGGSSQGSIATAWAMHQNFVEDCSFDLPELSCAPAHGYNVKAALLLASVVSGVSGRPAPVDVEVGALDEGRSRVERNVVMLPSSEPLAGIGQWPAVFFAKGLWDFAESLEATFDAYRRVTGMKELVVVRAPHAESDFGQENTRHVTERMVAFARAAVLGQTDLPGAARFADLKELVATSPPYWEPSSAPAVVGPPTRVR